LKNEDIVEFLTIGGANTNLESTLEFIRSTTDEIKNVHRAIVDEQDIYYGTVSLKNIDHGKLEAEYAIAMHPKAIGTGVAATGTSLILDLAFGTLQLKRVYLNVLRINQRAIKFYDKLGFNYTHSTMAEYNGNDEELVWYEVTERQRL